MGLLKRFFKVNWHTDLKRYLRDIRSVTRRIDRADGKTIVINVQSDPLYEERNPKGPVELNRDVFEYIDYRASVVPTKLELDVRFWGKFSREEEEKINILFHRHYEALLLDKIAEYNSVLRKAFFLLFLGAAAFFLNVWIDGKTLADSFLPYFCSTLGSILLWDGFDTLILERKDVSVEILNTAQIANSRISFLDPALRDTIEETDRKLNEQELKEYEENQQEGRFRDGRSGLQKVPR